MEKINVKDIPNETIWRNAYNNEVVKNKQLRIKIRELNAIINKKDKAIKAFKEWQPKVAKHNYEYWLGEGIKLLDKIPDEKQVNAIKSLLNSYNGLQNMETRVQKAYNILIKSSNKLKDTL